MFALLKPYLNKKVLFVLMACCSALMIVAFSSALFHDDSALQIRSTHQGIAPPDGFYVWQRLNAEGIHIKSITPDNDSLVLRFNTEEQSSAAAKVLHQMLPEGFDINQLVPSDASKLMSQLRLRRQSIG